MFRSVNDLIRELERRMPKLRERRQTESLKKKWMEITGEYVARSTRPVGVADQGKTLVIEIDHPSWRNELRPLIPDLIAKCKSTMPYLNQLRFVPKSRSRPIPVLEKKQLPPQAGLFGKRSKPLVPPSAEVIESSSLSEEAKEILRRIRRSVTGS